MANRLRPVVVVMIALSLAAASACSATVGGVAAPAGQQTSASSVSGPPPTLSPAVSPATSPAFSSGVPSSQPTVGGTSEIAPTPVVPPSSAAALPVTSGSVVVPGPATSSGNSGGGDIPKGAGADCMAVASAYASITFAILPVLQGQTGSGAFDAGALTHAFAELGGQVPPELAPDFATLSAAAKQVIGKDLTEAGTVFSTPAVSAAQSHIEKWLSDNC